MSEITLDMEFDTILEQLELKRYLGHVTGMTEAQARAWMWEYYQKELERVSTIKAGLPKDEFEDYFFRLYAYNQKVQVIDHEAVVYCDTDNTTLKTWLWIELYQIYDHIKHFKGVENYRSYRILGYEDCDDWMRDVFSLTIGECLKRFDYHKKKSLVGYTVDTFRNYRLKDDITKRLKRREAEVSVDKEELPQQGRSRKNTLISEVSWQRLDSLEAEVTFNRMISRIVALMVQIYEKQRKKDKNMLYKADYFRFYFTEMIVDTLKICKEASVDAEGLANEREVLEATNQTLLDYIMENSCDSYWMLMETNTKTYDSILRDGNAKRISMPIHEAIYTMFINEILQISRSQESVASSISKYRALYREQMRMLKDR